MTYGISSTGFTKPTLQEIQAEWATDLRSNIDPGLDLEPDQPFGQVISIGSQREAKLWEVIETLANAVNPGGAEGFLADNIAEITGTVRDPARKSTVMLTCGVGADFVAAPGVMMANVNGQEGVRFINLEAVNLTGYPAGSYPILFECTEYGPTVAVAGTLTVRTNSVSGWNSCTNALDATLGNLRESDASLLNRREEELAAPGACTVDSIRADVLQVTGVNQCFVFENQTLLTDGNGLPGKSIEVVVYDGTVPAAANEDIGATVWKGKPSGSETYGTTSVLVTDSTGTPQAVNFSRATVVDIYLDLPDVVVDPTAFPTDGLTQIKTAIVLDAAKRQRLAVDVVATRIKAAALTVPGVLDVPTLYLGTAPAPGATVNIAISGREIASFDTSRISVVSVEGTP